MLAIAAPSRKALFKGAKFLVSGLPIGCQISGETWNQNAICGWTRPPAAVGVGADVFSADDFSERDAAIGYHFRVLDEIGGVADNTPNQDLPGGEFHVAPNFVFMLVTDVAGFDPQSQFLSLDS